MSVSVAHKIFRCISIIGFGGLFIFLGVALHLAYTRMDVMLDHLKDCPSIWLGLHLRMGGLGKVIYSGCNHGRYDYA